MPIKSKEGSMITLVKGSKTELAGINYTMQLTGFTDDSLVDIMAVFLRSGQVRDDDDFVFFNNPKNAGATLVKPGVFEINLREVPLEIDRVVVAGSTESAAKTFGELSNLTIKTSGDGNEQFIFTPEGLRTETVVQLIAFYRRGEKWKIDAIGQGYAKGLAAFARDHGIAVDDPGPSTQSAPPAPSSPAVQTPKPPAITTNPINMEKVKVVLTKDSPSKKAKIDLRKSMGEPGWVLTVGLKWDGRGARYDKNGRVTKYGEGDLDVYFFCRNEDSGKYVVISGERKHRGTIDSWPFIHHGGDSRGPGRGGHAATEQVQMKPNENGDILVNIYQSVDNGLGALNTFGRPRVVIRYGRAGRSGQLVADSDEITIYPGNGRNSFWATVAHIDVQDGILTVDGQTHYSRPFSERMPILSSSGKYIRSSVDGPIGQSKKRKGLGLNRYEGTCPEK